MALSKVNCPDCSGWGLLQDSQPCGCVARAAFQECYNHFRFCVEWGWATRITVNLDRIGNGTGTRAPRRALRHGMNETYTADFYLIAKRTLAPDDWQVFKHVYLLGADWKLLQRMGKTSMMKDAHMQTCLRIERTLGRAFHETQPFPLHPLDQYFSALPPGSAKVAACPAPPAPRPKPLRPPLRRAA